MQLIHGRQEPRVVVLGLDGLSLSLAKGLCSQKNLPGLQYLLQQGASSMRSELPELSPVNWTSFYTGAGPETHGIFGFTRLDPRNYQLQITDFSQVACQTIFDQLGQKQLQSRVINLPNTYPARPIPGILISGFVALELDKAVQPKFLLPRLHQENYKLEADTSKGAKDPDFLLGELQACLRSRQKALELFWPDLAWNVFVLVLTELDRLGHFLFPALKDTAHPWHTPCIELLQDWDRILCQILERFQHLAEPKRLLVLADHGFNQLRQEVDLNAWLTAQGYLQYYCRPQNEWDSSIISAQSLAFALDPGRIYLHTRSGFSRGRLQEQDLPRIKQEIKKGLLQISFQGQNVLEAVLDADKLYPGCQLEHMPDLVCVPKSGFELKAKFDRRCIFGLYGRQGVHDHRDAFFWDSQGARVTRVRQAGQQVLDFFKPQKDKTQQSCTLISSKN